uniref:Uncharacterized protein n=1 Tax=Oryza barthii TaxID=65489 RepID=A0A0D3FFV9_9ORYZ
MAEVGHAASGAARAFLRILNKLRHVLSSSHLISEDITNVHINKIITGQITVAATKPFQSMEFGRTPALQIIVGVLWSQLQFGAEAVGTTVFTLRNNCTYTVWPATLSGNTAVAVGGG